MALQQHAGQAAAHRPRWQEGHPSAVISAEWPPKPPVANSGDASSTQARRAGMASQGELSSPAMGSRRCTPADNEWRMRATARGCSSKLTGGRQSSLREGDGGSTCTREHMWEGLATAQPWSCSCARRGCMQAPTSLASRLGATACACSLLLACWGGGVKSSPVDSHCPCPPANLVGLHSRAFSFESNLRAKNVEQQETG